MAISTPGCLLEPTLTRTRRGLRHTPTVSSVYTHHTHVRRCAHADRGPIVQDLPFIRAPGRLVRTARRLYHRLHRRQRSRQDDHSEIDHEHRPSGLRERDVPRAGPACARSRGQAAHRLHARTDRRVSEADRPPGRGRLQSLLHAMDGDVFARYMERFKIDGRKRITDLSTGMRVKLGIAMALSHGAEVILLDEPTSGLDPIARDELLDLLGEVVDDGHRSVLYSTHITSDLDKSADFVVFLRDGRIIANDTKDDL